MTHVQVFKNYAQAIEKEKSQGLIQKTSKANFRKRNISAWGWEINTTILVMHAHPSEEGFISDTNVMPQASTCTSLEASEK